MVINSDKPKELSLSKIMDGIMWTFFSTFINRGFTFIVKLILARLLLPEDFGLIGMALVFTTFIQALNEMGVGSALIQRKKDNLTDTHFQTVFWFSIVFSSILFVAVLIIIAPTVAWFYDEQQLRLIVTILSIPLVLNSLVVVQKSILMREMNFKIISLVDTVGVFISSIIAIFMAFYGAGVWSIVIQSILPSLFSIPFFWVLTNWNPKLIFSRDALKDVFSFGIFVTFNKLLLKFVNNLDFLLIGRFLGSEILGLYTIAFTLTDTFKNKLMQILDKVFYPVYGQLQDEKQRIAEYYLLVVKYNTIFIIPIMTFIIIESENIMSFFGDDWTVGTFPLQMLAIATIINSLGGTSSSVLLSLGKAKLLFSINLFSSAFIASAIIIGIVLGGMNGVSIAVVVHKFFYRAIHQFFIKKYIMVNSKEIIKSASSSLIGSSVTYMIITIYYRSPYSSYLFYIGILIVSLLFYLLLIISFNKKDMRMLSNMIKNKYRKRGLVESNT